MAAGVDIQTDDEFQRKDWKAERIAWIILLIFFLLGISGFFGKGGVSSTKTGSAQQNIEAKYQRFLRYHTQDILKVKLHNLPDQDNFSIYLDPAYVNEIDLQSVNPEPEKYLLTNEGMQFQFAAEKLRTAEVVFHFKPGKIGSLNTFIKDGHGNKIDVKQFVYP